MPNRKFLFGIFSFLIHDNIFIKKINSFFIISCFASLFVRLLFYYKKMVKIFLEYIFYFVYFIFIHYVSIVITFYFIFSFKTVHKSNLTLSPQTVFRFRDQFGLIEKKKYLNHETKEIEYKTEDPVMQINQIIYFRSGIGIFADYFKKINSNIIQIQSHIPF